MPWSSDYGVIFGFTQLIAWAKCIRKLKGGKATGYDGLTTEHLVYAHPLAVTLGLRFGVVPTDFGCGVVIPLLMVMLLLVTTIEALP